MKTTTRRHFPSVLANIDLEVVEVDGEITGVELIRSASGDGIRPHTLMDMTPGAATTLGHALLEATKVGAGTLSNWKPVTFRREFFAWLGGISLALVLVGCGPTSRTAYLRDAATAHVHSCAQLHASPMNTFWCEEDARKFCAANGLEPGCWE